MWRHFQWNEPHITEDVRNFLKEIPLWWFPDSTFKLNNSRTAWPIPAIYTSFSSILNALSYEIDLFSRCSSPSSTCWSSNFPSKDWQKPNGQAKMNPSECLMPRSSHPYLRFTGKWPPQRNLYWACIQSVALNIIRTWKKFCLMNIMFLKDKHWDG